MDKNVLLEYLSIVVDLEKDQYAQKQAIIKMDHQIAAYKQEHDDNEKRIRTTCVEYDLEAVKPDKEGIGGYAFGLYYLGFFGVMLGVLLYKLTENLALGILGGAVGLGISFLIVWKVRQGSQRFNKEKKQKQLRSLMEANQKLNVSRKNRNHDLTVFIPRLENEQEKLLATYEKTVDTLVQFYALDVIPEKYRGLVPVCSFYDYVSSGRTYCIRKDVATFDEGAINIFEREQTMGVIIDKLDQILSNLQALNEEQRAIRYAIEEGNRVTHSLLREIGSKIDKVNDNIEVTQYQNDQQLKCQQYMASMVYQNSFRT